MSKEMHTCALQHVRGPQSLQWLVNSAEAHQPRVALHLLAFLGCLVQEACCWIGSQLLITHPDKQRVRIGLQAALLLNMLRVLLSQQVADHSRAGRLLLQAIFTVNRCTTGD